MPMTGRAALFMVAVAVGGCQGDKSVRVDFSDTPRNYFSTDYGEAFVRWTRHEFVLREVEKALEVWATYKSWDFREAYVEHYASIYSLSDADKSTLRNAQRDACQKAYEFHVTAQSANYKWNDLDKPSSPWRVTLIDALGHELQSEPIKIEKLPDGYEREFFPSKTPFSKTYSVRFVAAAGNEFAGIKSGALTLRFASPLGRVEVSWRS
jgi:hypothetical protein